MAKYLTWGYKAISFVPPAILSIYPGPDDVLRPSNKLSLRPNDKNVLYRPPGTYEYQYQIPQMHQLAKCTYLIFKRRIETLDTSTCNSNSHAH